ncbi:DNA-binding GntR family transcriptional regulator [Pedobacter sp. AK017]|uniref:GntR family transcriptional regulator n=1 Tax=Pedobacter sp. AK017 TaxID=2723073 RepID=UPI001611E265|nr:GntR family transcriptional regulator [Pedobacter sp. AK017]MBB5437995.1 DNA-binding GntR family transcriptional regulator [Pedobacter sp. AK017]
MKDKLQSDSLGQLADPTYSRVREKLREDILSGYFISGERLKIAELVERYKVSQMPIREALQQLQGEGLLIIEPNKGAHVRKVDKQFLESIYEIRQLIEVYLTVKCIENLKQKDLKLLNQIQKSYESAAAKEDYTICLQLNRRFHSTIYELANNSEGLQILEKHWQLINTLRLTYGFGSRRTAEVIEEHQAILLALESRNPAAVETAASVHCVNAKADLLAQMGDRLK